MKLKDIIGTDNRFLAVIWSLAVFLILALGLILNSSPVSLLGVAESREYQINFDTSVEIKHIYVFPSQRVKKGDLLVELNQSALDLQLRTLKARYDRLLAEVKLRDQISRIANDKEVLQVSADPLQIDLADTKKEMELIETRLQNLFVFAEVDGTVGAVNFKNGEKAPAFAPLLTLLPQNPSYVNGFMNENLSTALEVGQKVEVTSTSGKTVQGIVTQVGSRIVQIPDRLLRIQSLPSWGREVVVKIPAHNEFLLGEKVSVKKAWGVSFLSLAQAEQGKKWLAPEAVLEDVQLPQAFSDEFDPELSGLLYMPELKQFLAISDDYPEDRPFLMMMSEHGELQERPLYIEKLEKMGDIESISRSGNYIYLLSSLSLTKKGKSKEERQLFTKIHREGMRFVMDEQVDLRVPVLNEMAKSSDVHLRALAELADDFEVEGHFIRGDDLFLALKGPLLERNQVVIIRVKSFAQLFQNKKLAPHSLSLEYQVTLPWDHSETELVVTDVVDDHGTIYVATSCRKAACSAIWRIPAKSQGSELVQEFPVSHLEGLAIQSDSSLLFGVFDDKKRPRYFSFPLAQNKGTP
ncbi:HlyD family efflux transporter periplasmic adaptor subunit [Bdellovibrio sp. HCB2-146]|uniref:HlyD family efflux transporter periplasmic adaptor subunit n=1 Tax=Bdellovibrio sp. HCB2-146 TaxID=3394362 RepID=UPI0039BC2C6F